MPEQHLVPEDLAAYFVGRPASTIRRWATEGRITKHHEAGERRNGVRYDLDELPAAQRDDEGAVVVPGAAPPLPQVSASPAA